MAADAHSRLERVGQMHMGEFVNRMHRATLVEHPAAVIDSGTSDVDNLDIRRIQLGIQ